MTPLQLLPKLYVRGIRTAADLRAEIARSEAVLEGARGFHRVRAAARLKAMRRILAVLK